MILSCLISLSFTLSAQNPYLPLWEFIPDGEPYVFEDPDCPASTVSILWFARQSQVDVLRT